MYVLAEIASLPQKAWVVSLATCAGALFALLHTACRPNYATLCISRGATRPEWQQALPITLPLISPFSLIFVSVLPPLCSFLLVYQDEETAWYTDLLVYQIPAVLCFRESVKTVDCCWHAAWFSYWSVRAGQRKKRMICPLLSVGFLCAVPHLNAK